MVRPVSAVHDAIVVGGGPAGAATAIVLARAGWSVVLLERARFPRRKVCGEYVSGTTLSVLDALGVGRAFRESAGPPVTEVAVYAGASSTVAALPPCRGVFGRALARERLDALLLERAAREGAEVLQPCRALAFEREGDLHRVRAADDDGRERDLLAPVAVDAHGSWDRRPLEAGAPPAPRAGDLLGFKAAFRDAALPRGRMPLLSFPGGYGGMVASDDGRTSLSCCVRRDALELARVRRPGDAGDAVAAHVLATCAGAREALEGATRDGPWLAAGPIRPGVRLHGPGGVFRVGNAAGEAHPVVAEGITMAVQGAWLLAQRLVAWREAGAPRPSLRAVAAAYRRDWRRAFSARVAASCLVAQWAMRPALAALVLPVLRASPPLLTFAARLSGKATAVTPPVRRPGVALGAFP